MLRLEVHLNVLDGPVLRVVHNATHRAKNLRSRGDGYKCKYEDGNSQGNFKTSELFPGTHSHPPSVRKRNDAVRTGAYSGGTHLSTWFFRLAREDSRRG